MMGIAMSADTSKDMGRRAELSFAKCMHDNGHTLYASNSKQDMFEHWDFLVDGKYRVEVKGLKKAKRHDSSTKNDWIYVEFKNVRGDDGWIYGKADYVAFEQPEGFLIVPRVSLVELAETKVTTEWANRPTPYKSYRRNSRPYEHVGVVMYDDLLSLPHRMVKYHG